MSLHGLSTVEYHYGILQNLKTIIFYVLEEEAVMNDMLQQINEYD